MGFPRIRRKKKDTTDVITIITASNDPETIAELISAQPALRHLHACRRGLRVAT